MLKAQLIAQTTPMAEKENFVYWADYRVTVLTDRLFRIEKSPEHKFRDMATQAIWHRNTAPQQFTIDGDEGHAVIETPVCRLILYKERSQCYVEVGDIRRSLNNYGNLLGTYRTLDCCNGDYHSAPWEENDQPYQIQLEKGVCSKTGVAIIDDSDSLTLGPDGEVKNEKANGTDEYVFVYGNDYRNAVRALYMLTGRTPLLPRFALGNWWSRYHTYTADEYLRVLNRFEDKNIPISVATVDMDWHYSANIDAEVGITASGKSGPEYVGTPATNVGWTGYTWNRNLFPDPKGFMEELHERGMKITLNLHPSDGFRWWEDCYQNMASAMGIDPSTNLQVPFDFSYDRFINAYFDLAHTPLEEMGVDFWWIDWQQPDIEWHDPRPFWQKEADPIKEKYDPLWALNHYHYYDNATKHTVPMILSRYSGVGSHRYPIGFSGDTEISWRTLAYLPYFTATATNVGYTWWSHDIGGHNLGEKSNELFARHVQYGVFSPITRLHCTCDETMTKEPWAYGGGAGLIAEEFLRFRHKLVPYLYNANYLNCVEGTALVEPMYYEWKDYAAYNYKEEYRFGSELIVAPVTQKAYPDGYARVRAWIPEGKWTDIFTGDVYEVGAGGKETCLLRTLESIPVLAKAGAILPLSADNKNAVKNPEKLEIWAYEGTNVYTMYEDGLDEGKNTVLFTEFKSEYTELNGAGTQSLIIFTHGDPTVIPQNREMKICFKNVEDGYVRLYVDGKEEVCKKRLSDCVEVTLSFAAEKTYRIEVIYPVKTRLQRWLKGAQRILTESQGVNYNKEYAWRILLQATTEEEYVQLIDALPVDMATKLRLKETL
ncbi:MAG: alpha-xylosidase [Clostridia bacterium]|nr:alpha-xylosidase [Clostridia bacterium]